VSNVSLKVYDIMGREVAVLINDQKISPGLYNTEFDGSNLASDIYYKIIVTAKKLSTYSDVKKLVLLK
jgi:hypothetical protein